PQRRDQSHNHPRHPARKILSRRKALIPATNRPRFNPGFQAVARLCSNPETKTSASRRARVQTGRRRRHVKTGRRMLKRAEAEGPEDDTTAFRVGGSRETATQGSDGKRPTVATLG